MLRVKQKLTGNLSINSKLTGNLNNKVVEKIISDGIITFTEFDNSGYPIKCILKPKSSFVPQYILGSTSTNAHYTYKCHYFYYLTDISIEKSNSNIKKIGQSAFQNLANLININLPSTIVEIESNVFLNCKAITSINLPNDLTKIGSGAFSGCTNLTSINLPSGLLEIGAGCFQNCSNLIISELPISITNIGNYTFSNCKKISELVVKSQIQSIGSSAFSGCTSLFKLVIESISIPNLSNSNAFRNTPIANGDGYIYVVDSLVDDYKSTTNWSTYANQIKPISELEV